MFNHRALPALGLGILLAVTMAPANALPLHPPHNEFLIGQWTTLKNQAPIVAGVRGSEPGYRSLAIRPICEAGALEAYSMAFAAVLDPMFGLYVRTVLHPALQEGSVEYRLSVDGGEAASLGMVAAEWQSGLLTVNGTLESPSHWESLLTGSRAVTSVYVDGHIVLTQSFSLQSSSDALAQLTCQ